MSISAIVPTVRRQVRTDRLTPSRLSLARKSNAAPILFHAAAHPLAAESSHGQAELFYLQKQIHAQTPMVVILEDGEQIEGCIEWYDRNSIKIRGRQKTLIYKSAIKYMYKLGDVGR